MLAAQLVVARTWAVGLGALPNGMWISLVLMVLCQWWDYLVWASVSPGPDQRGPGWRRVDDGHEEGMVLKQARLAWQGI